MKIQTLRAVRQQALRLMLLSGMFSLAMVQFALPQNVVTSTDVGRAIVLEDLVLKTSEVLGTVHNRSPDDLRDLQLLIRYTWLWQDETKPGENDPSASAIYRLDQELKPGQREKFIFKPTPPLPSMSGGQFAITVSIFAYTAVKAVD